jgi:hypothetical protein
MKDYEARTVESSGWANLHGASPLSESSEAEIISCLNGELNSKFATSLDDNPVIDRQAGSPDSPKRFVVIGSSHAARLCAEFRQLGHSVIEVARPGWRAMPGTVASMKELLEQKIAESGGARLNDVYVFQLWDNTLHAAWAENSATIPHTKDSLGKYHLHGEAIIVPVSTQTDVFKMLLPLLRTACNHSSVLVGPLPRYLYVSCCRDKEHVTNMKNDDFRTKMRAECDIARQKIRDSAWINGLVRTKVINPGRSLREFCERAGVEERQVWGDDPVHPDREGYKAIVEEIVNVAALAGATPVSAKRAPDRSPHGDRKRVQWTGSRGGNPWGHRGRPGRGYQAGPPLRFQRGYKRGANRGRGRPY